MAKSERITGRLHAQARRSIFARQFLLPVRRIVRVEETAGWPLIIAAAAALIWANSPWSQSYSQVWETSLSLDLTLIRFESSLKEAVTNILLPVFFFVIGIEVKRELQRGELTELKRAMLPLTMAFGGAILPAGIYLGVNLVAGGTLVGWGVPIATDIAFALAVLTLLGDRVPGILRVLLLAFATIDDVIGVLVIALFYSQGLNYVALGIAGGLLLLVIVCVWLGVRNGVFYLLLGVALIAATGKSGVHTTIAGVALGLIVPGRPDYDRDEFQSGADELEKRFSKARDRERELLENPDDQADEHEAGQPSPLTEARDEQAAVLGQLEVLVEATEAAGDRLMGTVNPWVGYLILPLFAISHAGVAISGSTLLGVFTHPEPLGVFVGLLLGKPIGLLIVVWLATRLNLTHLPERVGWSDVIAIGLLAGIGFTIALFIAQLAFGQQELLPQVKVAIFLASLVAGVLGLVLLCVKHGLPSLPGRS